MTGPRKSLQGPKRIEMQVISLGESYSGLQEGCHSRVRDPLLQNPGAGKRQYATREHEDLIYQQSEVVEKSEQRLACTSILRDILAPGPAET